MHTLILVKGTKVLIVGKHSSVLRYNDSTISKTTLLVSQWYKQLYDNVKVFKLDHGLNVMQELWKSSEIEGNTDWSLHLIN